MTSQKEAQKAAISNLTDQVANIQQVDTTQLAVQITSLQALLQASYSATGSILKMSIVNYL
jgi:flagellin-like hook-associated protein FlgL